MPVVSQQRQGVCCTCQTIGPVRPAPRHHTDDPWDELLEDVLKPDVERFVMDDHNTAWDGQRCLGSGTIPQALVRTAYEKMGDRIDGMSDQDLTTVWRILGDTTWSNDDMWDHHGGIAMNDWAEAIKSEMEFRNLPKN